VRCRTHEFEALTDQVQVRDQTFTTAHADQAPEQAPLGPRLAGLALVCVTLFGLATVVGLFANSWA
jgi:hypothetical protein